MTMRCHVRNARLIATNIDHNETKCAPHSSICSPAMSEDVVPAIDVEFFSDWPMNDQQMRAWMGRRLASIKVIFRLNHRSDSGDENRQIFRATSGHDGIDCNLLDGGDAITGRNSGNNFLRIVVSIA